MPIFNRLPDNPCLDKMLSTFDFCLPTGSTAAASAVAPVDFVRFLNQVFTTFDCLVERHGRRQGADSVEKGVGCDSEISVIQSV